MGLGFPIRVARSQLGPTLRDARPVLRPEQQISAATMNAALWDIVGCAAMAPLVRIMVSRAGTLLAHVEAWAPSGGGAAPTVTRAGAGELSLVVPAVATDETGDPHTVSWSWWRIYPLYEQNDPIVVARIEKMSESFRITVQNHSTSANVDLPLMIELG